MFMRRSRWILRSFAVTFGLVAAINPPTPAAGAQQGCEWVGDTYRCGIVDDPGIEASDGRTLVVEATMQLLDDVAVGFGVPGQPAPCALGTDLLDPAGLGILYLIEVIQLSDGLTVASTFRCVGPGEDPLPPPPPTRAEIWDSAPIPQPVIHLSPIGDGLVGLDTWLWGDNHGSVTVTVSLRGWTVSGTVTPTAWVFETSDGGHYTAPNPGSENSPVGAHIFGRQGTYTITHTVEWGGAFTVSGYGLAFTVTGLSGDFAATAAYPVIEIEAVNTHD
jgi:hypothetical protein